MYNAVFSAVMTLTGLTFAAIGLLLEGRERHWIRHADVWQSLRFRGLLPVAVAVGVTCGFVLWRIDISDDSFTLWWWLTIGFFVVSLGMLGWSLVLTRRLVEPASILERLRRRMFTEQTMSVQDNPGVSGYMVVMKELLTGTLGEGDTNNYRVTHEEGLVSPSCPPTALEDCVSAGFPDAHRIRVVGLLATEALGEARAQFDASSGSRTVNLICADTMTAILDAWSNLKVPEIKDMTHRKEAEAARARVLRKGCDSVSQSLAGALAVPRPSQTLVDKLSLTLLSVLPNVDGAMAFDALERVLSAAERAVSAGNIDEASGTLGLVTPQVIERLGSKRPQALRRIAESVVQVTTAVTTARRPQIPFAGNVVPAVLRDHEATMSLLAEMQKTDDQTCTLLLGHIYGSELVASRRMAIQAFFEERFTNDIEDSSTAAERAAMWLQPVADHLARSNPARLKDLRQHVVSALRGRFSASAVVNPVYLMVIFAMIRVERRRMRDEQTPSDSQETLPLPAGTLSNILDGSRRSKAEPARVPVSPMLWQCFNVLENGLVQSRESGQPLPFSPEVRRSIMGSLSYVVHAVDDGSLEDIGGLLYDEKLVRCIETLFEMGIDDLGEVDLFLDRFRVAAEVALSTKTGRAVEQRSIKWRWLGIRLLCGSADPLPAGKTSPDGPETDSGVTPEDGPTPDEELPEDSGLDALMGLLGGEAGRAEGTEDPGRLESMLEMLRCVPSVTEPEVDVLRAMENVTGQGGLDDTAARKLCAWMLSDLASVWLPDWADRLREECTRAEREGDVEAAMFMVRTVRSCFKRLEGSRDRVTVPKGGPFYVFRIETQPSPDLLDAARPVMVAMLTDWLTVGIDRSLDREPTDDELRKSANFVAGTVRRAMRGKFTGVRGINRADEELQLLGEQLGQRVGKSPLNEE